MGHLRELANDGVDSLGFDLSENSGRCRFRVRGSRAQETIQNLQAAVNQVKTVVLATDADREGETIAWHIQQSRNLKNLQRVVYSEITPAAVQADSWSIRAFVGLSSTSSWAIAARRCLGLSTTEPRA